MEIALVRHRSAAHRAVGARGQAADVPITGLPNERDVGQEMFVLATNFVRAPFPFASLWSRRRAAAAR